MVSKISLGVDALEVISQDKRSERQAKRKDEVEERMEAGMEQDKQFVLLLDSGNTRLKCRCIDAHNGVLYQQFSVSNTQLDQAVQAMQTLAGEVVAIHAVAVTSAEFKQRVQQACERALGPRCPSIEWHHSAQDTVILRNLYEPIHHLGNDRWFGMIGVLSHAQSHLATQASVPSPVQQTSTEQSSARPIMYISFGTATTVDTIYKKDFLGGMILPGVELMQNSLKQGTAQLPLVAINAETRIDAFPRGTQAAITAGIVAAQAGAIVRQCLLVREQLGGYPDIYVAGGARFGVLPELKRMLSSLIHSPQVHPSYAPSRQAQEVAAQVIDDQEQITSHENTRLSEQAVNQSVSAEIALYELEAPVLDGLHYHYVKESLGK